jgi:hypothetical protein
MSYDSQKGYHKLSSFEQDSVQSKRNLALLYLCILCRAPHRQNDGLSPKGTLFKSSIDKWEQLLEGK